MVYVVIINPCPTIVTRLRRRNDRMTTRGERDTSFDEHARREQKKISSPDNADLVKRKCIINKVDDCDCGGYAFLPVSASFGFRSTHANFITISQRLCNDYIT